tara:strand:+ start:121 stop:819 length:699 start_codon:yes stop_codon:yes gene_type:complete
MIKVKIVKFVLDMPLKRLIEKVSSLSSYGSQGNSCTLTEFSDSSLSAVYVEKVVTRETIIDLQGKENVIDVVRYPRYEFQIQRFVKENEFLLLVFNPPRSLRGLIEFLVGVLDKNIYFRDSKISVDKFIELAKSSKDIESVTVDKVKVKGVEVSRTSYADITISSSFNAYHDLESFLDDKNYKISNARTRLKTKFGSGKVEVSSTGLLGIDEAVFDEILFFFLKSASDVVVG